MVTARFLRSQIYAESKKTSWEDLKSTVKAYKKVELNLDPFWKKERAEEKREEEEEGKEEYDENRGSSLIEKEKERNFSGKLSATGKAKAIKIAAKIAVAELAISAASMGIAALRTLGKFATNGMARETVAGPRRK